MAFDSPKEVPLIPHLVSMTLGVRESKKKKNIELKRCMETILTTRHASPGKGAQKQS